MGDQTVGQQEATYNYNMKTIAITIDEAMLNRLDRAASGRGGRTRPNRSRVIREAIGDYIRRLDHQAQEEQESAIVRRHRARLARQAGAAIREQAKP